MNTKNIYPIIILIIMVVFSSCSDEQNTKIEKKAKPGKYTVGINLDLESTNTKAANSNSFDKEFEADAIYLQSINAITDGGIQIPIYNLNCADGSTCKGFKYQIEVDEEGDCIITPYNGEGDLMSNNIKFRAHETLYFSSVEGKYWEHTFVAQNNDSKVYERNPVVNKEIYRSSADYSINDLTQLGGDLTFVRLCSAFDAHGIFTDMPADAPVDQDFTLTREDFEKIMGSSVDNWYMKIYIGPVFTGKFNMVTAETAEKEYGFYATHGDAYQQFSQAQTFNNVEHIVQGWGYKTSTLEPLIAPFDARSSSDRQRLSIYIFVKHWTGGEDGPDDAWTRSDAGAKYVQITENFSDTRPLEYNYRYKLGAAMDIYDLRDAFHITGDEPLTRGIDENSAPQEMFIKHSKLSIEKY